MHVCAEGRGKGWKEWQRLEEGDMTKKGEESQWDEEVSIANGAGR